MPFALRTALRHARRRPLDATLNVAGLAVGLALVALVGLYLADELSVDRFHPDADRVVRLSSQITDAQGEVTTVATGPEPLGRVVRDDVPGVEAVVRLQPAWLRVERGGEAVRATGYAADASFFDVLGFRLVQGDPATALPRPGVGRPHRARGRAADGDDAGARPDARDQRLGPAHRDRRGRRRLAVAPPVRRAPPAGRVGGRRVAELQHLRLRPARARGGPGGVRGGRPRPPGRPRGRAVRRDGDDGRDPSPSPWRRYTSARPRISRTPTATPASWRSSGSWPSSSSPSRPSTSSTWRRRGARSGRARSACGRRWGRGGAGSSASS